MAILAWGKCTITYAKSEDGAPTGEWTQIDTPKEDTTQLTPTNGTEKTATEEGGAVVDYMPAKNSYDLEFDLFCKKGVEAPFTDDDGPVAGEYAFRVVGENEGTPAIQIDRASVRVDVSYASTDGILLHHAIKVLKPAEGKLVKIYTPEAD